MQPDLLGLEISKGELRRLSGFDPDDVFRTSTIKDSRKRFTFFLNEIFVGVALTPIIVGFIYAFIILPTIGSSINLGIVLLIVVPIAVVVGRLIWRQITCPKAVSTLLDDVDKYHAVIKAIDVNDQLEASGAAGVSVSDRTQVIEALQLIRDDLVRALKTERILRENKDALANHPELFANNLMALKAMQVNTQASEYGLFLNQALQIGFSVQEEMRQLQRQRSNER